MTVGYEQAIRLLDSAKSGLAAVEHEIEERLSGSDGTVDDEQFAQLVRMREFLADRVNRMTTGVLSRRSLRATRLDARKAALVLEIIASESPDLWSTSIPDL